MKRSDDQSGTPLAIRTQPDSVAASNFPHNRRPRFAQYTIETALTTASNGIRRGPNIRVVYETG
jgi:hypothetical protein